VLRVPGGDLMNGAGGGLRDGLETRDHGWRDTVAAGSEMAAAERLASSAGISRAGRDATQSAQVGRGGLMG